MKKTIQQSDVNVIKELLHLTPKEKERFCRLTFRDSSVNSNKFYEIWIEPIRGNQFQLVAKWGRIGSSAQSKVYVEGSYDACNKMANKLKEAKIKKGYSKSFEKITFF